MFTLACYPYNTESAQEGEWGTASLTPSSLFSIPPSTPLLSSTCTARSPHDHYEDNGPFPIPFPFPILTTYHAQIPQFPTDRFGPRLYIVYNSVHGRRIIPTTTRASSSAAPQSLWERRTWATRLFTYCLYLFLSGVCLFGFSLLLLPSPSYYVFGWFSLVA